MMVAVRELRAAGMPAPICIGVHAIFAGDAYLDLKEAGAGQIVTCNSVDHVSNTIDLAPAILKAITL